MLRSSSDTWRRSTFAPSTTLSNPEDDVLGREHALEIVRTRDEEVGGQHLLNDGAHVGQREVEPVPAFIDEVECWVCWFVSRDS
jgi:hypothetical protein